MTKIERLLCIERYSVIVKSKSVFIAFYSERPYTTPLLKEAFEVKLGIKTTGCWCAKRTFVKLPEVDVTPKNHYVPFWADLHAVQRVIDEK